MNADSILKTDVLDILFENRNKAYGAYALRKFYPGRIKRSLMIVFLLVAVFCVYAIMPKRSTAIIDTTVYSDPTFKNVAPLEKKEKKETVATAKQKINSHKLTSNIQVAKDKDSVPEIKDLKDNIRIGSTDITDGIDNPPVNTPETPVVVAAAPNKPAVQNPATVVEHPDVIPEYPGGIEALRNFLQRNLQNPRDMEEGEMVAVKIKFIVGYDGALKGFETVQDGGEEFNNEVIRVLKRMPHWIPGKSNGDNVSVYYSIPVKFVSND